jgi:DNA-binding response OmpR family regulator
MAHKKKPIGSILLKQRNVTSKQLAEALRNQREGDLPLVSSLVGAGAISETEGLKALSEQSGCPGIDLNQVVIRTQDLAMVPRQMAESHTVLPVLVKGNRMFVAMADPRDDAIVRELEMVTGKKAFPYISLKATLRDVIAQAYDRHTQGHGHFVGSKCSPETLRKAGVTDAPPASRGPASWANAPVDEAPSSQLERRLDPSQMGSHVEQPVILDDKMAAASDPRIKFDEPTFAHLDVLPEIRNQPYPSPAPGLSGTLLVVDGDVEQRRRVANVFSSRGFRVIQADRGDVALQLVRDDTPDVIVLDTQLPVVHGFEVARQLKSIERYSNTKIVMVSSTYKGWRIVEDLKANFGVDEFLEKPFSAGDIVHAVENALRKADRSQSAPDTSAEVEPYLQAGIQAYKEGRMEEAIVQLRAGIDIDPLAYKVHFQLGLLYGKQGQLYDGIQELETALSVRSDFFPALKNLAVLYQNAGFRMKALEMWERSLAAAPDDETREMVKRMLVAVL